MARRPAMKKVLSPISDRNIREKAWKKPVDLMLVMKSGDIWSAWEGRGDRRIKRGMVAAMVVDLEGKNDGVLNDWRGKGRMEDSGGTGVFGRSFD